MNMVDEIAEYLEATGYGTLATDLFKRQLPDDPDEAMCVLQLDGSPGQYVQDNDSLDLELPMLEIMTRSLNPETAELNLDGPYRELMKIKNQVIGGTRYVSVRPVMVPSITDRDDNGRFIARCDFDVRKELSSAT